jgi:hypothetical protein
MKNFVLCLVILVLGTVAVQNFTKANQNKFVSSSVDLGYDLSDSDLDKINGIVDEKLDPIREDLRTVERILSDQIEDLQTKLADCNARTEQLLKTQAPATAKSGGSSGSAVANKYESKPAVVKSIGGSTGTVVQNVYSQPVVSSGPHWTYPGDIASHLQNDHGQSVSGMSVDQQLTLHDSIHESQRSGVTRTVTRSNLQSGNCPGGVCPTSASTVTRSFSRPRFFRR